MPISEETLDEVERAWPAVLKLIREYDAAFPYAEKEGDDQIVTRMNTAIARLREERKQG